MKKLSSASAAENVCFLVFSQDTIPLFGESHFLKVQQKSDNLMFRFTLQVSLGTHCNPTISIIYSTSVPYTIIYTGDYNMHYTLQRLDLF